MSSANWQPFCPGRDELNVHTKYEMIPSTMLTYHGNKMLQTYVWTDDPKISCLVMLILECTSRIYTFSISHEIALRWMPQHLTDD